MFDTERFFRIVQRRAQQRLSLSRLGFGLVAAGVPALLALVAVLLFVERAGVPRAVGVLLAAFVLAVSVGFAVVALRRTIPLAHVTFELDRALGLDARISSLLVLWRDRRDSPFLKPLQAVVARESKGWRSAYRMSWRARGRLGLGVVCVVLIAVLPFVGLPHISFAASVEQEESATASELEDGSGSAPMAGEDVGGTGTDAESSSDLPAEAESPQEDESLLNSFLSDLLTDTSADSSGETLSDTQGATGAESVAPDFAEYLDALLAELAEAGARLLTDAEQHVLRAYGDRSDAELSERIASLLAETDADRIRAQLSELKERSDELGQLRTATPAGDEQDANSLAGTSPTDVGDTSDLDTPLDTGRGVTSATDDGTGSSDAGSDGDDATGQDPSEEESVGASVISDIVEGYGQDTPDVVEAAVRGSIGDEGTITEYITAGVPLDYGTAEGTTGETFVVDYEQAEAILTARSVPQDAQKIVRDYFELISGGDR